MEEGRFGDVVGMGQEQKGGIKNDSRVVDLSGGVTMEPSILSEKSWVGQVRGSGPRFLTHCS